MNRRRIAPLASCLAQENIKWRAVASLGSKQGDIKARHGITNSLLSLAGIICRSQNRSQLCHL